ncbi:hypothetical protein HaLaN_05261, partial [Haematococcus lacustris]
MIPRQCQVGTIVQPSSTTDVVAALAKAKAACKAAGGKLSVRASRQLYHASSDLLCPEAQALRGKPACSVVLDMERMKEVVRIDAERKLKALARRMHDKKLRSSLSSVLGDKNLVLIQWLPDVMQ